MNATLVFTLGLGLGTTLGLAIAWWLIGARPRMRAQIEVKELAERLYRTEATNDELRSRLQETARVIAELREKLAESQKACAVAETKHNEAARHFHEQKELLQGARRDLEASFQALSGEALKQNNEAFLQLARSSFANLQGEATGDLSRRQQAIDELVRPLQDQFNRYEEHIREVEQARRRDYGGLEQHLKLMAESQRRLQQETGNLVKALRVPAVRGRWGEITLKRVAELAGMVAQCDFVEQPVATHDTGLSRPDMVVRLPAGRHVVVDAKTVLSAYLDAYECQDESQRLSHLIRHASQVRSRIDELGLKAYWNQFPQAPEFVVLFLPGEQFLGAALEQDPSLIEDGFSRGIVIATPATLVALLRAVAYGWRQEQLAEHAVLAGRLGKELYERMAVLAEHLNEIGQSLGKSVHAYNKAVSSLESRIMPTARKFKDLGVSSDKELDLLNSVEQLPRRRASLAGRDAESVG
ncbi:MAG TPA: DNA recombination protein RmuC [Nitrospiraceae bacterium]|nr:DNA recombination protein RmuC [Nitrospiraceae bacterium]